MSLFRFDWSDARNIARFFIAVDMTLPDCLSLISLVCNLASPVSDILKHDRLFRRRYYSEGVITRRH